MFQPDEPRGIRNLTLLWFVLMVLLYAVMMSSCSTVGTADDCPRTQIIARSPGDPDVAEHMVYARAGCVRYYGKGACLTVLRQVAPRDYQATCKRKETK